MSRRHLITMTDEEAGAFLAHGKVVICATNGKDGFPHLMPLWYVIRDGNPWAWTYAKSQKVRNLERDPRATLQVEAGVEYQQLRGVMLRCDVTLIRDTEQVAELGLALYSKYSGTSGELLDQLRQLVLNQAPKRVAMRFVERGRATWDHRKLAAGGY